MCSLKSAGPIIGPASSSRTEIPRSASTFVTVPPPAPEPITTTSWTVVLVVTCAILMSSFFTAAGPHPRRLFGVSLRSRLLSGDSLLSVRL